MFDLAVTARIARDLSARQFAAAAPRAARTPAAASAAAPVRLSAVRVLRRLADRLEPAPSCAPQS